MEQIDIVWYLDTALACKNLSVSKYSLNEYELTLSHDGTDWGEKVAQCDL
jgi:hypothetical protein